MRKKTLIHLCAPRINICRLAEGEADLRLATIHSGKLPIQALRCPRGNRDEGCRAPQVEPESPRRAADPYDRLVA